MFQNTMEYLRFGAGRPLGTIWSMEKAYFELRRKYPAREEALYIQGSLLSRYPDRSRNQIDEIARECRCLEDAMIQAVKWDFGEPIAARVKFALFDFPTCSQCGKHLALSGKVHCVSAVESIRVSGPVVPVTCSGTTTRMPAHDAGRSFGKSPTKAWSFSIIACHLNEPAIAGALKANPFRKGYLEPSTEMDGITSFGCFRGLARSGSFASSFALRNRPTASSLS